MKCWVQGVVLSGKSVVLSRGITAPERTVWKFVGEFSVDKMIIGALLAELLFSPFVPVCHAGWHLKKS